MSNLVGSSISNFENERSQGELDDLNALNNKKMISLDNQKR